MNFVLHHECFENRNTPPEVEQQPISILNITWTPTPAPCFQKMSGAAVLSFRQYLKVLQMTYFFSTLWLVKNVWHTVKQAQSNTSWNTQNDWRSCFTSSCRVAKSICFFANVWPQLKTPAPVIKFCNRGYFRRRFLSSPISLRRYFFQKLIFHFSRGKFSKKCLAQPFWASDNT